MTTGRTLAMLAWAGLMGLATVVGGWWTLPILGAVWGVRRRPFDAGVAALVAWAGILAWQALRGPVPSLAVTLADGLPIPAAGLPFITLAFAGLIAWSAARLAQALLPPPGPPQA